MGLHVGGIFVRTDDAAAVVRCIKEYWHRIGANLLEQGEDPLSFPPLSLQKTGKLGYAVCPASKGPDDAKWVAVYDSEHYHASGELAHALAAALDTPVVIYGFTGSVNTVNAGFVRVRNGASNHPTSVTDSKKWDEPRRSSSRFPTL